jgi:hypothetical protein
MYALIGSHFVPLEGNTCSISYCKDNVKCDSASNAPKCPLNNGVYIVKKTYSQTLKHFENVSATGGNKIVDIHSPSCSSECI